MFGLGSGDFLLAQGSSAAMYNGLVVHVNI